MHRSTPAFSRGQYFVAELNQTGSFEAALASAVDHDKQGSHENDEDIPDRHGADDTSEFGAEPPQSAGPNVATLRWAAEAELAATSAQIEALPALDARETCEPKADAAAALLAHLEQRAGLRRGDF